MSRRTALVAFFVALLASMCAAGCGASADSAAPAFELADATQARLIRIARQEAARRGAFNVSDRLVLETTRAEAAALLEKVIPGPGNARVYLVWMHGNFGPWVNRRPHGYRLILTVDTRTLELLDATVVPGELEPGKPDPRSLGGPLALSGNVAAPPPDDATIADLREIALRIARNLGEPQPSVRLFRTNAQKAAQAESGGEGGSGDPERAVYLLVLTGRFENHHSAPGGGPPLPAAPYLAITLNADDLQVRSVGWMKKEPDVSRLLQPISLLWRPWFGGQAD